MENDSSTINFFPFFFFKLNESLKFQVTVLWIRMTFWLGVLQPTISTNKQQKAIEDINPYWCPQLERYPSIQFWGSKNEKLPCGTIASIGLNQKNCRDGFQSMTSICKCSFHVCVYTWVYIASFYAEIIVIVSINFFLISLILCLNMNIYFRKA